MAARGGGAAGRREPVRVPPRRLLVPVDPSLVSLFAVHAARGLAERWGSSIELVRVREPAADAALEKPLDRTLRGALDGFPPGRLRRSEARGWAKGELAAMADPERADLVVMGTHGVCGLDRALLGSVAEHVIRLSRVPVLVVQAESAPLRVSRVLAPWNGRPYATRALRYAGALTRALGAELRVLRVVPGGLELDEDDPATSARLDLVLGGRSGPAWTYRVRSGSARDQILREARSGRYGLVAVSAHRRRLSADVVFGSTVERLLRHSRASVLAFPDGPRPRSGRDVAPRSTEQDDRPVKGGTRPWPTST